jgi:hypothetical protein
MGWLLQDIRYGFRTILKDRAFLVTAVLALALGIGSTTAISASSTTSYFNPFPIPMASG